MATKKAAKKTTKKSARKTTKKSAAQARKAGRKKKAAAADPPITIKGGSLKVHYKRGSFNHGGDEDSHKNDVVLTMLVVYRGGAPYRFINLRRLDTIYICYNGSTCVPITGAVECS